VTARNRRGAGRPRVVAKRGSLGRRVDGVVASSAFAAPSANRGFFAAATTGITAADAIAGIPDSLREELLARFNDVVQQYRRSHWEAAILNAGKFCEVVYTIIRGKADGEYPERAEKPANMVRACQSLEQLGDGGLPRALRIQIPRCLLSVYEIRGNRGTGHAGAEIEPNHMDAEYVLHACQWMVADLVRAFHALSPDVARDVVGALTERIVPLIWDLGDGMKRVLDPAMETSNKALLLLYATPGAVSDGVLCSWTEYKNPHRFKNEVLPDLHARAHVHYDRSAATVVISPIGQRHVELKLLAEHGIL